jgi:hypothetical protein
MSNVNNVNIITMSIDMKLTEITAVIALTLTLSTLIGSMLTGDNKLLTDH